jgi:signal transduction histidine kinase
LARLSVPDAWRVLVLGTKSYGRDAVFITVRDTGLGLDPARRDRVFDALYTTKPDGMGLGLAICRTIVEAHGGRLWALANADRGETFQFSLPLADSGVR